MVATIAANGKAYEIHVGKNNSNEYFFVDFEVDLFSNGKRIKVTVHPKTDIILEHIQLDLEQVYAPDTEVLVNGYQSGLESRRYKYGEKLKNNTIVANHHGSGKSAVGSFFKQSPDNDLTSWSYTYITRRDGRVHFLGSLKEWTGFTTFEHDQRVNRLTVSKDCRGLHLSHSYPALDIYITDGTESEVFDRYFEQLGVHPRQTTSMLGWTTARHYRDALKHALVTNMAKFVAKVNLSFRFIMIDMSWQVAVGDWQPDKDKFSKGLTPVATAIKNLDLKAGIALAPFAVSGKSDMFAKHPEWLLQDAKGKPLVIANNPSWGGDFYSLNILHSEVRDYLTGLFHTIVRKWGFGMIKLEYLFIAAVVTPPDKTRGQIMFEVMQFLRNAVGLDTHLVVADVPLSLAFGVADTCQIGSEMPHSWDISLFKRNMFLQDSEQVIESWLARSPLGGRGFLADAQRAFVHNSNLKFTQHQGRALLYINALCGNYVSLADNIAALTFTQRQETLRAIWLTHGRILRIETLLPKVYEITFEVEENEEICFCNLTGYELAIRGPKACSLAPFETKIVGHDIEENDEQ